MTDKTQKPLEKMSEYNYTIRNFKDSEPLAIARHLNQLYLSEFADNKRRKDYYCGIATDLEGRFRDHETNHWVIEKILAIIDCGDPEGEKPGKAALVETIMGDRPDDDNDLTHTYYGFDVGSAARRGEGDHTRYVYFVKKGRSVSTSPATSAPSDTLTRWLEEIQRQRES